MTAPWMSESREPCDWDHQSLCIETGCTNPATHRRLLGMADDIPVVELICCQHATNETDT